MRTTFLASLLIGTASLAGGAAQAATVASRLAGLPAVQSDAIAPAREAGERPRREDRRNDRRNDRRVTGTGPSAEELLVLVREGSSRNRGRRGP